jgi:hypothetical protein
MKHQKDKEQFVKYYIWLLKNIFGNDFEEIKSQCEFFKDIVFSDNYVFPPELDQEHKNI